MNDIGISSELDAARVEHLFKIGIFAALIVLAGDMLLGFGVSEPGTTGLEANFSRYMTVPDWRIFWSATLGLIGIPLECLCYFGVYRLTQLSLQRIRIQMILMTIVTLKSSPKAMLLSRKANTQAHIRKQL